jgi:hypothetical protein
VAEIEADLKVRRMERDIPKFDRTLVNETDNGNTSYTRGSIEDLLQTEPLASKEQVKAYQPVLYQIIKDPKAKADKEGLS